MAEPIAIVGSACRFPGSSTSPSKLWELLKSPRDVLREFPTERLDLSGFYSQDGSRPGCTNVRGNKSYLLSEDCRVFDAAFFRINNKEANGMDPQQRILLETVYEGLETAGWPLERMQGSSTAVYVGAMTADYSDMQARDPETLHTYAATGVARSMLANRISYYFDLRGPSMTIDTACSSSLHALHLAVQGLRTGDAETAIVAGTALLLDPFMFVAESKLHMLSPDARSRMWDKDANGYARGEGCAALVLKPLRRALEDNDHVECVIRETGVGSDGRTNGITVPSAPAQAQLIRRTYERAGLDPMSASGRCQYFECHGTGTLAGDPVEAEAIKEAFFPGLALDVSDHHEREAPALYCGSVKTVIGHLEGCAGLAGVLKASLAIRNGAIPPNMHFGELHPALEPYYHRLCVPTSLVPWPSTSGEVRRASINSFGFGGSNSHLILEEAPEVNPQEATDPAGFGENLIGPFVFSAKTRSSLVASLRGMGTHIQETPECDLDALSWVLQMRRTAFPERVAVAAINRQRLLQSIAEQVHNAESGLDAPFGARVPTVDSGGRPKLLGIFTGQGAQWVSMGQELVRYCHSFRATLGACEEILRSLPSGPSWSLMQEMATSNEQSISRAEIAQPVCAALQIALVDLLRASGIQFDAVVGHSSGEIGAAYAAGLLSARDAMGIAYYRGLVAQQPGGIENVGRQKGGMMAVGLSYDAAAEFCSQPRFSGRISVAASNAPASVTLSGDLDGIKEAKAVLDHDQLFARILRVDVAYHSHHMDRLSKDYATHLRELDVKPQVPREDCAWYSSVQGQKYTIHSHTLEHLKSEYWVENMVKPVLFSQSLELCVSENSALAAILEVGPHAALKAPVYQTINGISDHIVLPYAGCLSRGQSDIQTLSAALGLLWSHFAPTPVDFEGWRKAFGRRSRPQVLKGLPSYAWDHDQVYWHETRLSREYRSSTARRHGLLGRLHQDHGTEMTWRNVFRRGDLSWLQDHKFQGQAIFPAAGYVSMAVQAVQPFVRGRAVKMIEILDMNIAKAFVLEDDCEDPETLFTMKSHHAPCEAPNNSLLSGDFTCFTCTDGRVMNKSCDGRFLIHLGPSTGSELPPRPRREDELPPLDVERFFGAMSSIGIDYDGIFRAIRTINRSWGVAHTTAIWREEELDDQYLLHPAVLDIAFQTGFATFASIADNAMVATYLPSSIKRIVIDSEQRYTQLSGTRQAGISAHLVKSSSLLVEVDTSVFAEGSKTLSIQVEGLILRAIVEPQPCDDRRICAKTVWEPDVSYGLSESSLAQREEVTEEEMASVEAAERTALFFLHNLDRQIRPDEVASLRPQHQTLLRGIQLLLDPIRRGHHPILKREWLDDSRETIKSLSERFSKMVDIALLRAVGENLPSVVRGESEMLEHMLKDNLLGRLYSEGRGFSACNDYVAEILRKISHKQPRINILEIGAGTGATTSKVLEVIGSAYGSYTYTDISAGFFETAVCKFGGQGDKMRFKTLNAEERPSDQGFNEGSFDVVIAANVLHATRQLSKTVQHVRSMLRPGGFLVAVEVTGTMLRETGLMGGLEGWWLGVDEGRFPFPGISAAAWDQLLRDNGFSGIDSITYDLPDVSRHSCSVFTTQALDESFALLRNPSAADSTCMPHFPEARIAIIGGRSLALSKASRYAGNSLRRFTSHISSCQDIDTFDPTNLVPGTHVLSLAELEDAIFAMPLTSKRLNNLQEMLGNAKTVLWVTSGAREDPHKAMMPGIGRALAQELPHVQMQFVDLEQRPTWCLDVVTELFIRAIILSHQSGPALEDVLWAQEPEISIREGVPWIPRILMDQSANDNLNATRRRVTRLARPSENVEVSYASSPPSLTRMETVVVPAGMAQIEVEMSVATHSHGESSLFLCLGRLRQTENLAVVLTEMDSSATVVSQDHLYEIPPSSLHHASALDARTLIGVGASLIAAHIISNSPDKGIIVVHDPVQVVAEAITAALLSARSSARPLFLSSTPGTTISEAIFVHPLAQTRDIRSMIPGDVVAMWCFSDSNVDNISSLLPELCLRRRFNPRSMSRESNNIAAALVLAGHVNRHAAPRLVNIGDLRQDTGHRNRLAQVLEWRRSTALVVDILPTSVSTVFASDKTYLLVGMTGELGQSLCRFMVRSGARHIVLASRNPCQNAAWVTSLNSDGADIRMVTMDVADRSQVRRTRTMIQESMPAIAGIANAALVLEDALFVNTTVEVVEKQLDPKVKGTIHLEDEFSGVELEFFVLFSSLGTVYGSPGQSIYHAANMFMTNFAARRQRTGRAASVINVGMISDVGYVAKAQRAKGRIEQHLRSQFYTPLSDTEFHHLFVQAIVSGRPGPEDGQLTMGIEPFVDSPETTEKPPWYANARFSHMVLQPTSNGDSTLRSKATANTREKLDGARSTAEASEAFRELFCLKLQSMMQMSSASIDPATPLSDFGLDSLLAVEIRSWLLKEFDVAIPLLGILRGESVSSITPKVVQTLAGKSAVCVEDSKEGPLVATECSPEHVCRPGTATSLSEIGEDENPITWTKNMATEEHELPDDTHTHSPATHSGSTTPYCELDTATSDSSSGGTTYSTHTTQQKMVPCTQSLTDLVISQLDHDLLPLDADRAEEHAETERASWSQTSLHFLGTILDDPTTFNVTAQYDIRGHLNVHRLSKAFRKTLARHEAFRTSFFTAPGGTELRQAVAHTTKDDLFLHIEATVADARRIFNALSEHQWNLRNGHTFRAILVTHAPDSHSLVLGCHHIIMDGTSWHIFFEDLTAAYQMAPLGTKAVSALEASRRQSKAVREGIWQESVRHWLHQLDPLPRVLPLLPLAQTTRRVPQQAFKQYTVQRELGRATAHQIRTASRTLSVTPMNFHLAVIQTLLARLSNVEDLCIGVAHSGRGDDIDGHAGLAGPETIGHFTNLLPMRFWIDRDAPFTKLSVLTSEKVLDNLAHAHVPIDYILERLDVPRSAGYTPLFQVAFNYRSGELLQRKLGNCTMDLYRYEDAKSPYDLTFTVTQRTDGGDLIEISSNAQLYSAKATEMFMDGYTGLLESLSIDPSQNLKSCTPTCHEQARHILSAGRGPVIQHPWPNTLTGRFQQVSRKNPGAIAIRDGEVSVAYRELASRVDAAAAVMLHRSGIKPGSRVAVLCEPGVDLLVALLAILHIGAIYVPFDPTLPLARKSAIMEACVPALLVFHTATAKAVHQIVKHTPTLDVSSVPDTSPEDVPVSIFEDEAFWLFTSGSTGKPKGIRLLQSGLMNYSAGKQATLSLDARITVLQQSSIGFDMSIAQIVNAFANGGTLVVVPMRSRGDPIAVASLMAKESVTFTICTPSEYLMLTAHAADILKHCSAWEHACSGGEAITDGLIAGLRSLRLANLRLTDCYGPTEASCAVTLQPIPIHTGTRQMSVGKPIPNTDIYVLDDTGRALPPGFIGEIGIGGRGLSKGYLDEDLTAKRFVLGAPVSTSASISSSVIYLTGDKGCLQEDGSLVLLGRVEGDTTVKLRGFRIDLDEVANAILSAGRGTVLDAVVTVRGHPETIVAHIVSARDRTMTEIALKELRGALSLPYYMIPSIFATVEKLPTTTNGKVDRKALSELPLPAPVREPGVASEGSLTVAEEELRLLWKEIVGEISGAFQITADTDFFMVGGSSLLLVRLQGALKERLGVSVPLHELYNASSLRSMASMASEGRGYVATKDIDWASETAPPTPILDAITKGTADPHPRASQRHVLLTGATGFLGSAILTALLRDDDVARVHCVAVLPTDESKIPIDPRITTYTGSLSSPGLGLASRDISSLQPLVDQIIHAGAQGHCLNNYASVRCANYLSTQFLAEFALPRRVPLHFISSPRVTLFSQMVDAPPVSMARHRPPVDGTQGFTSSKWASECFLEAVARLAPDFPVVVHRPCSVVGDEAAVDDAINAVIRYSRLMSCVPDVPDVKGFFDFKDVNSVAAEITRNAASPTKEVTGAYPLLSFLHYSSGVKVPFGQLARQMESLYGGAYETVSLEEWIHCAVTHGIESVIVSYLRANVAGSTELAFPYMGTT